jgi:hypothetical protein
MGYKPRVERSKSIDWRLMLPRRRRHICTQPSTPLYCHNRINRIEAEDSHKEVLVAGMIHDLLEMVVCCQPVVSNLGA